MKNFKNRLNRPVKSKILTAENSPRVRYLEMRKAKNLLSTSKHEIPEPEPQSVLPSAVDHPAPLTPEQRKAADLLNFATNKEIRKEFRSVEAYIAYKEAEAAGKIKIHGSNNRSV
jgi:hypothetical protein